MTLELLIIITAGVVLAGAIAYHVMYARAAQLGFDWIRSAGSYEAATRLLAQYDAQTDHMIRRGVRQLPPNVWNDPGDGSHG